MDTSYRELKCKDVVNIVDGRNLGRTCDIVFTFPEGKVYGIVVPGKRGCHFFKNNDLFISLKNVVKIGADVVLVDLKDASRPPRQKTGRVCLPAVGGSARLRRIRIKTAAKISSSALCRLTFSSFAVQCLL